jgi:hypothetical protein
MNTIGIVLVACCAAKAPRSDVDLERSSHPTAREVAAAKASAMLAAADLTWSDIVFGGTSAPEPRMADLYGLKASALIPLVVARRKKLGLALAQVTRQGVAGRHELVRRQLGGQPGRVAGDGHRRGGSRDHTPRRAASFGERFRQLAAAATGDHRR